MREAKYVSRSSGLCSRAFGFVSALRCAVMANGAKRSGATPYLAM